MLASEAEQIKQMQSSPFAIVRTAAMPWAGADMVLATDHFYAPTGVCAGYYRQNAVSRFLRLASLHRTGDRGKMVNALG